MSSLDISVIISQVNSIHICIMLEDQSGLYFFAYPSGDSILRYSEFPGQVL